jgi:hypothetical protein
MKSVVGLSFIIGMICPASEADQLDPSGDGLPRGLGDFELHRSRGLLLHDDGPGVRLRKAKRKGK